MRGLEILPTAHARTHTHKHTALSGVHRSLVSAEVCMWLDPSHRQAKDNEKNSGVDGSLTSCGDAQKESENKAFIPVFDLIRSVKSTKTVMLRYTRVSQKSGISTLASLSTAKPLRTCKYTSNNGRSIRGLEILPPAHARAHTQTHSVVRNAQISCQR